MRRPLLLVCVALAVVAAGCLGPAATGDSAPTATTPESTTTPPDSTTSDPTTTTYAGMGADGWYHSYTFSAVEATERGFAAAVAPNATTLEPEREPLVREGVANGSVTTTHTGEHGSLSGVEYVRMNGTYYAVTERTLDSERRSAFRFHLEGPLTERSREYDLERVKSEATAAADLSAPDRRAFFEGLPPAEERPAPGEGSFSAGYFVFYANDTAPANATLTDGETQFVAYEGAYYAVRLAERQRTTWSRTRYAFDSVADSTGEFVEQVRSKSVTPLSSLSQRDRSILAALIENGSVFWSGDEADTPQRIDALARVVHSLSRDTGPVYVSRNGTLYRITLREAVE